MEFTRECYTSMQRVPKRVLTIVVFAERDSTVMSEFMGVLKGHQAITRRPNVELFFMQPNRSNFLKTLLNSCSAMSEEEAESRMRGCTGLVATAVCLIGNKRQLMLFPQERDLVDAFLQSEGRDNVKKRRLRTSSPTTGGVLGSALGYESGSASEDGSSQGTEEEGEAQERNGPLQSGITSAADQVAFSFGNWLERLADGSLRRWTISQWPDWT